MESIFNTEDNKSDNLVKFQTTTKSQVQDFVEGPINLGTLLLKTPTGALVPGNFQVFRTILIFIDPNDSTKTTKTSIKWKRLEPFQEDHQGVERFGFKMYGCQKSDEFYVENADELENWLDILGPLMINGRIEDDYETGDILGEGFSAKVYKAHCLVDGKNYAVKSVEKSGIQNKQDLDAMIHEIDILRDLQHESILRLHRVFEDETYIHLVTQLASGEELFTRLLKRKRFSEYYASMAMCHLLGALAYIHSKSIVHRDVKLENILMIDEENDGEILLIDFGLSSEVDGAMLKQQCGSPGYMAPEIIAGQDYGTKVDIFAAGCILYILLSGIPPYPGTTQEEVMLKNMDGTIFYPEKYWRNTSPEAIDLVLLMTNEDPAQRPSADVLISHPWFKMHHPQIAQIARQVAKDQRLPMPKPGPTADSKMMKKMNGKKLFASLPSHNFDNAVREEGDSSPISKNKLAQPKTLNAAEFNDNATEDLFK